jgi:hypothetical protein
MSDKILLKIFKVAREIQNPSQNIKYSKRKTRDESEKSGNKDKSSMKGNQVKRHITLSQKKKESESDKTE